MESIYHVSNILGEGPLWDHRKNVLYWLDIDSQVVHCLDSKTQAHHSWPMPAKPGNIALCGEKDLLVSLFDEIAVFSPDSGKISSIEGTSIKGKGSIRFNDGRCDAKGRFWVGTMDLNEKDPIGELFCLEGSNFKKMAENIIIGNGLGWSPDNKVMYFTDSPRREIYRYDFDLETGQISNRRLFAKVAEDAGYPDGLCVDEAGYVWSAHFMGGCITRYAPDGLIEQVVDLPVLCPSSCCIGGEDNQQLFVTSAIRDLTPEQVRENPLNGCVLKMPLENIKGRREDIYVA